MEKLAKKLKLRIKTGDTVIVIAGDAKGKTGTVLKVDAERNRALVEGVNIVKRHVKPTAQAPQSGGIVEKEAPIHISNLMVVDKTGKASRVGVRKNDKGKNQRYSKKTNNLI